MTETAATWIIFAVACVACVLYQNLANLLSTVSGGVAVWGLFLLALAYVLRVQTQKLKRRIAEQERPSDS